MDPPKKAGKVIAFLQPQDAVTRIEVFVERLVESNELLAAALKRLRAYHLAGGSPLLGDKVLAEVEVALETASRARNGF